MGKMLLLTLVPLLFACSDRQVSQDTGPSTDGPLPDKKTSPDGPVPDKKQNVTDGPLAKCPTSKPAEGASCTGNQFDCEYLIQKCPCGPSDIMWHCSCAGGAWKCTRDYDCYPCDGSVSDSIKSHDATVICKSGMCSGSSAGDCGCEWVCTDGKSYKVDCKQTSPSSKDCKCLVNSVQLSTCVYAASGPSCSASGMAQCCGFPN